MRRPALMDKIANALGYVKGVTLTSFAALGSRAYPSARTEDQLKAYISWVYACVKARSQDTATIKLHLYRRKKDGEVEEVTDHEVLSLLRSVNPMMTFTQLVQNTRSFMDLSGEAFWFLDHAENSKTVTQIWIVRPDYVDIKMSTDGFVSGYVYEVPGQAPQEWAAEDVIHFKEFNPINPYRGMGVVRAAAVTIDTEGYAEEYNKQFFRNSAVPEVVLSTEQKLSDAQLQRMQAQWKAKYGGTHNAHGTAILEGGLEVKQFGISQKDMEFLEGQAFSRDKILALFEMPKSRLGMTEGVTVSNAEATINIYLKYCVKRLQEYMRDMLNDNLLVHYQDENGDLFFDIDDPVPQDVGAEMDRYKAMFAMGAITPNEIRHEQGYDEDPELDSFFLPINLQPVGGDPVQEEPVPAKQVKQTGKKGRTLHIQAPAKPLKDYMLGKIAGQIKDDLMKALAPDIAKLLPSFVKKAKDMPASSWSYETKQGFWKQLVGKADRYEEVYRDALVGIFNEQEKGVLERLAAAEGSKAMMKLAQSDIERILISVSAENKISANILLPIVRQILEESGNDTLDFVGSEIAFDAATEAVKQFMREDAMKGIRVMNKTTKSKLRKALAEGIQNGLGPVEIARGIRDVFDEAKSVRALRVSRTEALKAANRGALEAYKQSGVVAGKEWFTSEDEQVCQWCAPLNGKVYALGQNFFNQGDSYLGKEGGLIKFNLEDIPAPPLHPNCRCTLVPITVNQLDVHNGHTHKAEDAMLGGK